MTNNLEELAKEFKEIEKEKGKIRVMKEKDVLNIIMEYGLNNGKENDKRYTGFLRIRRNINDAEKYDFTYMESVSQAYDSLVDNEFNDIIEANPLLKNFKELYIKESEEISKANRKYNIVNGDFEEIKRKPKKGKFNLDYNSTIRLRIEGNSFIDIESGLKILYDIFKDKLIKYHTIYPMGEIK